MLTKKDYIYIAGIIKDSDIKYDIVMGLCYYFKSDNPNFDSFKFLKAVGMEK
jgi:hypothetical protein